MYILECEGNKFMVIDNNEGYPRAKEISQEILDEFNLNTSKGKQYKVKNLEGTTFLEIFEEYVPGISISEVEVLKEQVIEMQSLIVDLTYNALTGGM